MIIPLLLMSLFSAPANRSSDVLYFLFRIMVGFLFMQHGLQKLGLLSGEFHVEGFMGFIGVCELAGGLAILLGVLVRLVAVLGTIQLIGAYTTAHMGNGLMPIANKGELALLFIATFLVLFVYGARKWSAEVALLKKEAF